MKTTEKKQNSVYSSVLAENKAIKGVAKSYEVVKKDLLSCIEQLTKDESYPITRGVAKKYLPKTKEEAIAKGVRFNSNGTTCRWYLLQYLYRCITNKLLSQQKEIMNSKSKGTK